MSSEKKRLRLRAIWDRRMIRPLIYKLFTRGILMLTAVLLYRHFVTSTATNGDLCLVAAAVFALAAVIAFLRLDGARIPQAKLPRFKKKEIRTGGDLADHIDDDIVLFDDLDDDEQNLTVFVCDIALMLVFLIASLF